MEGEPYIELLVLFLARQDVRSARCGLWRLRRELAQSITNDSMRHMMTHGRTGHLLDWRVDCECPSVQPAHYFDELRAVALHLSDLVD